MRRNSSFLLLWLLCLENVRVVHTQSTQHYQGRQERQERQEREERHERQKRRQQQQSQRQQGSGKSDNGGPNEDFHEYFSEAFSVTAMQKLKNSFLPKHIIEAARNVLVYSTGLCISGFIPVIGVPYTFLKFGAKNGHKMSSLDYIKKIGGGVLIGLTAWAISLTSAIVYAGIQVLGGIVYTPKALWAWIEGRADYQEHDGVWRYYNLTQHAETLVSSHASSIGKVEDDSLYKILGVEPTSLGKDIKRAYYKLAKEYHPDKNPDAQDEFVKIHQAYETLYDEKQRKAYDQWGSRSSSSSNTNVFDPGIFIDVFFGVSPELESYIGDLSIKTFSKTIMKISLAQQQDLQGEQQQKMVKDLLSSLKDNHSRDVRQVDIALFLQEFTRDYVISNMTEPLFREKCQHEAIRLLESTPFPQIMLETIGSALYWEGGHRTVQTPFDLPMSSVAWTRGFVQGIQKWTDYGINLYHFYGKAIESYDKANKLIRRPVTSAHGQTTTTGKRKQQQQSEEDERKIQFETLKMVLPEMIDFFWKFNTHDITQTLKGACWKVLHSNTCPNKRRQAKALKILGETLMKTTTTMPSHNDLNTKSANVGGFHTPTENTFINGTTSGFMDIQARFQVAFEMAMG